MNIEGKLVGTWNSFLCRIKGHIIKNCEGLKPVELIELKDFLKVAFGVEIRILHNTSLTSPWVEIRILPITSNLKNPLGLL